MSLDALMGTGRPAAPPTRRRVGLLVALLLVAIALAVWRSWPSGTDVPLDPDNARPRGTRALVQVLRQDGVDVTVARTRHELDEAEVDQATTLVLAPTTSLTSEAVLAARERFADAGRVVLVQPSEAVLATLDLPVVATSGAGVVSAGCDDLTAVRAGRIEPAQTGFRRVPPDELTDLPDAAEPSDDPDAPPPPPRGESWPGLTATGCYPLSEEPTAGHALLTLRAEGMPRVDLLGPAQVLTNEQITAQDDAALALTLLGSQERLVWFAPDVRDLRPGEALPEQTRVLPAWLAPMTVLLCGTVLLAMWWRGRRLGPLAQEPLPVLVHAAETTVARGRLYRRSADAGGREHAARALREATRRRLAQRLRLPVDAPDDTLLVEVADASGRPQDDIRELLAGAAPTDDTALAALAASLAQLEEEVRQP